MRLFTVGTLGGQLTTATKLATEKGANVTHADSNRSGARGVALWSRRRSFDG